jgi:glycerophosphoryl diester phosphodiesterase
LKELYQAKGFELILLEEILEHYNDSIYLNIELKAGGYERDVVALIGDFKLKNRVVISSFFPWVIKKVKDIDNQVRTGWIIGQEQVILLNRLARPVVSLLFKKIEADSAHLHYEIVTPSVVKHFHDRQAPVYAWTVNDNEVMKRIIDANVDGIITDRPAVLNSAIQREPHDESFIQIPGVILATSGENR